MAERTSRLRFAGALARSALTLARQGRLVQYLRALRGTYALTQVNLFLSLREVKGKARLRRLARKALWNRVYNDVDFERLPWGPFRWKGQEHLERALARGKGVLLCTQHVGPYRRLFFELVRRGLRVNVVMAAQVARSVEAQLRARVEDAELSGRLSILNAEQPGSVRDILAALARNEVVLVYLDGNTGVEGPGGSGRALANTVEVDFFGRRVAVRRGVCQISQASQAPLLPLFAWWERGHRPTVEFLAPLFPEQGESPEDFSRERMQRLFQLAEEAIRGRPEQFEEWSRVHRWRVRAAGEARSSSGLPSLELTKGQGEEARRYWLPPERFLLLSAGEGPVLVERVHGRILPVGPPLRDVVHVLGRREATVREVLERLGRRHSRSELIGALARLQRWELLEESNVRGGHAV